jgi:hypothetical protein
MFMVVKSEKNGLCNKYAGLGGQPSFYLPVRAKILL